MNPRIPISLALASLAALAVALSGCGRSAAQTPAAATAPAAVATAVARAVEGEYVLRLPARAIPSEAAALYPRATGFVRERRADLGDRVEQGQVLAVIAAPEIDEAVREADAGVGEARAALELARLHYERAQSLVGTGAIAQATFNDRSANLQVARAALAAAEARLASARERQGYREIRAPFAGTIVERNVERGDRVVGDSGANSVPLFEIAVLDPLRLVVEVPQSAALQIQEGLEADAVFPELPGQRLPARVVRLARRISEDAGGMRVELELPNPQRRLPAGMLGEVQLRVPRGAAWVTVPTAAVLQGASGARVARLGSDATVQFRNVTLGHNLGSDIEILAGLEPGETVILAPNSLLQEGERVQVRASTAPTG